MRSEGSSLKHQRTDHIQDMRSEVGRLKRQTTERRKDVTSNGSSLNHHLSSQTGHDVRRQVV